MKFATLANTRTLYCDTFTLLVCVDLNQGSSGNKWAAPRLITLVCANPVDFPKEAYYFSHTHNTLVRLRAHGAPHVFTDAVDHYRELFAKSSRLYTTLETQAANAAALP